MKTLTDLALIVLAGIIAVAVVTSAVSVISDSAPAKPAIYFILWAFALVPAVMLIVGALAAREAYYACRGPNQSVLVSTVAALVSAVAGIALWRLARPAAGLSDFIRRYLDTVNVESGDLVYLLVVYGLAGAIGGIVDYYMSPGRRCDIRPSEKS
jgi:hypothetical protein